MDPNQGVAVINGRPGPRRRLVAGLAVGGESRRCVVGIGGRIVVVEVAVDTLGRETGIHVSGVTRAAPLGDVRTDERPDSVRVGRPQPARIGLLVARVASGREPGRGVIRIVRRVVVLEVTVDAVGWQSSVYTTRMTR